MDHFSHLIVTIDSNLTSKTSVAAHIIISTALAKSVYIYVSHLSHFPYRQLYKPVFVGFPSSLLDKLNDSTELQELSWGFESEDTLQGTLGNLNSFQPSLLSIPWIACVTARVVYSLFVALASSLHSISVPHITITFPDVTSARCHSDFSLFLGRSVHGEFSFSRSCALVWNYLPIELSSSLNLYENVLKYVKLHLWLLTNHVYPTLHVKFGRTSDNKNT